MSQDQEYIPFLAIVDELERLTRKGVTGTLFVATRANKSAQIALDKGAIVSVYFYNKRGEEALELMLTIKAGRYRFQEGTMTIRPVPMPETSAVLEFLRSGGKDVEVSTQDKGQSSKELDTSQKLALEDCLTDVIGPMAAIICEEIIEKAKNLEDAIELLADEIPAADQAVRFRDAVKKRLG